MRLKLNEDVYLGDYFVKRGSIINIESNSSRFGSTKSKKAWFGYHAIQDQIENEKNWKGYEPLAIHLRSVLDKAEEQLKDTYNLKCKDYEFVLSDDGGYVAIKVDNPSDFQKIGKKVHLNSQVIRNGVDYMDQGLYTNIFFVLTLDKRDLNNSYVVAQTDDGDYTIINLNSRGSLRSINELCSKTSVPKEFFN